MARRLGGGRGQAGGASMAEMWFVLLEAEDDGSGTHVTSDDVARLLAALRPGPDGRALYCSDRYALQLAVRAEGPGEAVSTSLEKWERAVLRLGLSAWKVVRLEILTEAEYQQDLEQADPQGAPSSAPAPWRLPWSEDGVAKELLHHALSDPVTGLLGRDAFELQLAAALAPTAGHRGVSVVCLRLDNVAAVEARAGVMAGNQIRMAVVQRLHAALRPDDALARLSGDVYAVLLHDVSRETALAVAERMVEAAEGPELTLHGEVTVRTGVAVGTSGESAGAVIVRAEAALAGDAGCSDPPGPPDAGLTGVPLPSRLWHRRQGQEPPPRSP